MQAVIMVSWDYMHGANAPSSSNLPTWTEHQETFFTNEADAHRFAARLRTQLGCSNVEVTAQY